MRRLVIGLILSLPASLFAFVATAQDTGDAINPQQPATCQSLSSASRTRSSQCGDTEAAAESVQKEITLTFELPVLETAQCEAALSIEYLQLGATAEVTGVIENEDCGASGGEYTIQARLRDENGETKTLDFSETWQRQDAAPVRFTTEYPIGDNVELVRMRSRGLSCECADPSEAKESATDH
jgi:hypothetical protein